MLLASQRLLLLHQTKRAQLLLQRNPCLSTGTSISRKPSRPLTTAAAAYRMAASDASASTATVALNKTAHPFTRDTFEELMRSRFFYTQAFEIYGGAQ